MEDKIRINQYLAKCGACSRREADRYVAEGRVQISGILAKAGDRVDESDEVSLDGTILQPEKKVVLAYYKPVGVTCTMRDEHAACSIADVISYPLRVTYAGRLDRESEGLLLLTNDGVLIDRMMRAANEHQKEYLVKTKEQITEEFIRKMGEGIWLEDLQRTTRKCTVVKETTQSFIIVLTQGFNRQIRRMAATLGYHVVSIKRVRVMNILLGELQPGEYREINGEEKRELYKQAGLGE